MGRFTVGGKPRTWPVTTHVSRILMKLRARDPGDVAQLASRQIAIVPKVFEGRLIPLGVTA